MVRKSGAVAAAIAVFMLGVHSAQAQDVNALRERGTAAYNEALAAGRAGDFATACRGFNNATIYFENAISALLSARMTTEDDREYVKSFANSVQGDVDDAKRNAATACARRNEPRPVVPVVPSSPSPSYSSAAPSVPSAAQLAGKVAEVQRTVDNAYANAQDAVRKYEARDFTGACASAKAANQNYLSARDQGKAITKATGSFRDLRYQDIENLEKLVNRSEYEAKDFYCAN